MPDPSEVIAAGAVVMGRNHEVLLVHRPRYDDWTLPKGKLDADEHRVVAAVREVMEETGVAVRLGPPLGDQHYTKGSRGKTVHWWVGWPCGDSDVGSYLVNEEIDEVVWLSHDAALDRLSHDRDRATLVEAERIRQPTRALIVLRHAEAVRRSDWQGRHDPERPLTGAGHDQAERLVPLLAAYGPTRIVSSSSLRCVQTVTPLAEALGAKVEETDGLTQEHASVDSVAEALAGLVNGRDNAVLCSHRPVLPLVLDALRTADVALEPAGAVVVHHRREVIAVEVHQQP